MNRTTYWLAAPALALAAQSASAQINEADRLERCQNNRDALARLEAARGNYASEEQSASARTALVSIRRIETEINANIANMAAIFDGPERQRLVAANVALNQRIIAWGASVNFHCPSDEPACAFTIPYRLATGIDAAVAQLPQYRQFLQQVAAHNSNLIALRCDQPANIDDRTITSDAAGVPNFAGSWADIDGRLFYISQSGNQVTMTINIFGEEHQAVGSFSDGMLNMRWMAGNPPRLQQGSGTVISGVDGVAREIRFPGGFHYVRQ
ncbi:MAG: hypothetical protein ABL874_05265 [Sphingopyxis sp.]